METAWVSTAPPARQDEKQSGDQDSASDLVERLGRLVKAQPSPPDDVAAQLRAMSDDQVVAILRTLAPHLLLEALACWLPRSTSDAQTATTPPRQAAHEPGIQALDEPGVQAAREPGVQAAHGPDLQAELEPGNKRSAERNRMLRPGKIIYNNNMCVIDCTLKDISKTGCRVTVVSTFGMPGFFELQIKGGERRHDCEVVWRTSDQMGLRFLDPALL